VESGPLTRSRVALVELAATVGLAAAAVRYALWFFNLGLNLLDEGSQAAQANRLLHGDVIYRDFVTTIAPASYYTVAALFAAFGRELIVLRVAAVGIGIVILLATLAIGRHLMAWPFAAAAAAATSVWGWFVVAPNFYSWEAIAFALLALLCALRSIATGQQRWLVGAGLLAGLAAITKQNTGAFAIAAIAAGLSVVRMTGRQRMPASLSRTLAVFVASAVAPIAIAVAMLIAVGAGPYLFDSLVRYPFVVFRRVMALPYPPFYPLIPRAGLLTLQQAVPAVVAGRVEEPAVFDFWIALVLYLPVAVLPFALVRLAWLAARRDAEVVPLLLVTIFAGTILLQSWPRADMTHILFGLQASFVLLGYALWCVYRVAVSRLRVSWTGAAIKIVVAVAILWPVVALLRAGYHLTEFQYQNDTVPIRVDRARGILTNAEEARRIEAIVEHVTSHGGADAPLLVVPWAAGLYFLTDRPNPTRVDIFYDGDTPRYPCVIAALDEAPPPYVVYGYVWDIDGKHFRDYARPLEDYIRSRYVVDVTLPGYEILRRRLNDARPVRLPPGTCVADLHAARRRWK
jgi:hypothetical protein